MAMVTREGLPGQLEEMIRPIILSEEMELVELELARERRKWYLRIYIDKEGGVKLRDCENISRQVEILLDIEDPIPQEYILEVSSLGLDRPLKQRKDFLRCSGKLIRLITSMAVGGKKNFTGILKDTEEDRIQVELRNGKIVWISLSDIVKAQLEIEF